MDKAVEAAYGVDFDGDEDKIIRHLFKLYAEVLSSNKWPFFWPLGPFWTKRNPVYQRLFVDILGFSGSGDRI